MAGQGRPRASHAPFALWARAGPWLCCAALMALPSLSASRAIAAETSVRLRIAWGGGTERVWQGTIALGQGRFSQLLPLGIEADEPGSIWLSDGHIEVRQRSLRAYDGIDVLVTADLDDRLVVSLTDEPGKPAKPIEVPLRQLVHQPHNGTLDTVGNRVLISRSPGDRLRIRFDRESLVFAPGESFQFQIEPHLLESAGSGLRFQAQIATSPGGREVWSEEYTAGPDGTDTSITLKLPEEEGVYDLTIAAVQATRLRRQLRLNRQPEAERKIQLVVLETRPQPEPAGPLARVVEINPVNSRWWDRLGSAAIIPGLRKGPLGSGDSAPWEHPKLGPMIQLGPGGVAPSISWEAYPLPVNNPGHAHVLELEYPNNVPQAMGVSLLEPNAAGAVMPIGLDSGVYVSDEEAENAPRMAKHRLVFWPRTKTPLLLITNRRQGSRAVYGKITVFSAAHQQFPMLSLVRSESGSVVPPAFADNNRPERLMAGYLDRPLFAENFSAPEALDAASHRSLDDWTTFYLGGLRLSKYLKHVGYNGLMMSVYADGSTIYPSQVLEPTPRYDTGVFFATAQDPQRKDGLELLFRLFDREGLALIPALDFTSPLPELEALKRAGGAESVGLEWIGSDGISWLGNHAPHQGLAPYYNLLDPRVQAAMIKVARELCQRYRQHDSFGGVALQLSAEGYAQLPGEDWGYDDVTIAHFELDTKTRVPGMGPQRFSARAKYLSGSGRAAWLQWRAGVVADFHHRLESVVTAEHRGAKLYLAGATMLENRQTQDRLRPTLPRRTKFDDALIELGLRAQAYHDDERIVLLRPQLLRPAIGSLPAQAAEVEINLAREMDELFAHTPLPGSLFFHEPQKARLASFDAKSPFGPANTYTWLVSQMSPSGDANRRRFIHSLATLDSQAMFDGGWLLQLGQEDALKDVLSTYRLLPGVRFETASGESQPVTIRTLVRDRQTYVYLVNDSAWDVVISLHVDLPADCKMEKLGECRGVGPLVRAGGDTSWKITLRPYDLVAARFPSASVRVRNTEVSIPQQVRRALERRIQDLGSRVAALGNPQPLAAGENAGFELPPDGEGVAGWSISPELAGSVALDGTQKHGGGQSLKLSSTGQPVGIRSMPFVPPTTGRLAAELWLRASDHAPRPTVRIALEWQLQDGKSEERFGIISAVGANAASPGDWVRYSFPVDDLPGEGIASARIRFELITAGEVWVDDVQAFDLSFSEKERLELSKLITLANVRLEAGQFADCARLLEGYWPQFLMANVPLSQTPGPLVQRPQSAPTSFPPPPKKPGVLDNLRGYLPKITR